MNIAGLQKTTLVDFPGKVAATVFTRGCTFRCGFCHNPELVLPEEFLPLMDEQEILNFFKKRAGKLQGVCITGGEPTMQKDLPQFIIELKKLGYAVKLDTNGSNPDMLESLIKSGNLDYIAMDIKGSPNKYSSIISNSQFSISNKKSNNKSSNDQLINTIKESVNLIMSSGLDYEFRTTVCHPVHTIEEFKELGEFIKGAKRYFIQNFVQSKHIDKEIKYSAFSDEENDKIMKILSPFIVDLSIR